jgi:hypothetical protein
MKFSRTLLLVVSVVFLGACFHDTKSQEPPTAGVNTLPPVETLNEKGEVDEDMFEQNQDVSDDDDPETIEGEIESTVILEEDFLDL